MLLMIVVVVATAADTGTALGAALTGIAAVVGALWVIVKSIRSDRRVDRAEKREWERDRVEMERELKRVEREWDSARDTANRLRRELADERDDHRR
jgi:hypothetical protein